MPQKSPNKRLSYNLDTMSEDALAPLQSKLAAYQTTVSEFDAKRVDLWPIISSDQVEQTRRRMHSAENAQDILAANSELADLKNAQIDPDAQAAARRLLRDARDKVFATLPPLIAGLRRYVAEVRNEVVADEAKLFDKYGVESTKTQLHGPLDAFERFIAQIEQQVRIFAHPLSPSFIPAILSVFDHPDRIDFQRKAAEKAPSTPRTRMVGKVVARDIAQQEVAARADRRSMERAKLGALVNRRLQQRAEGQATRDDVPVAFDEGNAIAAMTMGAVQASSVSQAAAGGEAPGGSVQGGAREHPAAWVDDGIGVAQPGLHISPSVITID